MKSNFDERKYNAAGEFKTVITSYILPLFDVRGKLKLVIKESRNTELIILKETPNQDTFLYFYPCIGTMERPSPFYCKIKLCSVSTPRPATHILREILKVTEYGYSNVFPIKRDYGRGLERQEAYKSRAMDLAFELGMCQWIAPDLKCAKVLHTVICRMVEWAGRTYEGKNVPFGIVIDFNRTAEDGAADYLHFLTNDSSAVFTDGVFTGILLDKKGKVLSFLTRDSSVTNRKSSQDVFVPYQFVDIAKNCIGITIGIIVLTNGEILIIKNQAVCFAKRGRKWVYFDWNMVYSKLRNYFMTNVKDNESIVVDKIRSIYCTLLDVSFSHTGGCLALVLAEKEKELDMVITERIDLFVTSGEVRDISRESREKIEVLKYLLSQSPKELKSFFAIEKPLRKEILGLDGATVVSMDGRFYCIGSIVAVTGGSSGGGRTAAAKKLAYFGVGIKVSEDGYIEAYGLDMDSKGKDHIVPLFKFK